MTKIPNAIAQAVLAMYQDRTKLSAELTVRVRPCGGHCHFELSSNYGNPPLFEQVRRELDDAILNQDFKIAGVPEVFTFVQSPLRGTTCTNIDVIDERLLDFLLRSNVPLALHALTSDLAAAFTQWPKDSETTVALKAAYANLMRMKIWNGSNADPFTVRVQGPSENLLAHLDAVFSGMFLPSLRPDFSVIDLIAFDNKNGSAEVVRAAYALHAQSILDKTVEPEIFPKIAERMTKLLDVHAARLANRVADESTITNPTQSVIDADESSVPRVAAATSGAVDNAPSVFGSGPNGVAGQQAGATA